MPTKTRSNKSKKRAKSPIASRSADEADTKHGKHKKSKRKNQAVITSDDEQNSHKQQRKIAKKKSKSRRSRSCDSVDVSNASITSDTDCEDPLVSPSPPRRHRHYTHKPSISVLKHSTFDERHTDAFFVSAELMFAEYNITDQRIKFFNLMKTLKPQNVEVIKQLIPSDSSPNAYDELKNVLLQKYTKTQIERINALDEGLRIGMPPQVVYDRINEAYGSGAADYIKKQKFVQHMPSDIKMHLVSNLESDSMESVLKRAKLLVSTSMQISGLEADQRISTNLVQSERQVNKDNQDHNTDVRELKQSMQQMQAVVTALADQLHSQPTVCDTIRSDQPATNRQGNGTSINRSQFRYNPRQQQGENGYRTRNDRHDNRRGYEQRYFKDGVIICYYHHTFGDNARNCVGPCFYHKINNAK